MFNLSRAAQPVELDLSAFKGRVPVEMLGRTSFPPIGELPYLLTLPSHGFYWFKLADEAPMPSWHQEGVALLDRPVIVLFDGWTSLLKDRVMPWRIGFADRLIKQFETDTLPPHIEAQRWYASKGSRIARARLADSAIWDIDGLSWMLPLLDLEGLPEAATYFMPLALAWEDRDEERMKCLQPAAIAKVRQKANVGVMGDAFFDEAFCRALVRGIVGDTEMRTAHGRLHFRPTSLGRELVLSAIQDLPVSRPTAMSSNTVVTLGETLFLKGYRQLRRGINPELEMGRFLTEEAGFLHGVPVAGALEYLGDDGSVFTLALLQAYVPNQGDGWSWTLDYLERVLTELRDADGPRPDAPHGAFLALIAILGRRTAELHNALGRRTGNPAFDPEPMTEPDRRAMRDSVRAQGQATLVQLREHLAGLPQATQEDARRLLERPGAIEAFVDALPLQGGAGWRSRFHGDYHLGQVLLARNDFVIIDFEGEPARFDRGAPCQAIAAARCRRHAALLQLRALERTAARGAERGRTGPARRRRPRLGTRDPRSLPGRLRRRRWRPRPARSTRRCCACSNSRRPSTNCATNSATGSTGCRCRCRASWRCSRATARRAPERPTPQSPGELPWTP